MLRIIWLRRINGQILALCAAADSWCAGVPAARGPRLAYNLLKIAVVTSANIARSGIRMRVPDASASNALPRHMKGVPCRSFGHQSARGFTLVEMMVVMALLTTLMAIAAASIYSGNLISRRLSDYTAAMTVVQAKVEDIRAATYNPPNSPFTAATVVLTKTSSIALDQAGATFLISGTVTSKIEPVTSGHLVTVTGTFQSRRSPITVSLQTVVNKYSAGQQ